VPRPLDVLCVSGVAAGAGPAAAAARLPPRPLQTKNSII